MEIILLEEIKNLGKEGDVVKVKDGYGRNYLVPKKLALAATKINLKKIEELKKERTKKEKKKEQALAELRDRLEGLSLTIATEAKEDDFLYGNVKEPQILSLLQEKHNGEIPKGAISLQEPIDKLGVYKIPVKISKDLQANLRLWVVRK